MLNRENLKRNNVKKKLKFSMFFILMIRTSQKIRIKI